MLVRFVTLVVFELCGLGLDFDLGGKGGEGGCTVSDFVGASDFALSNVDVDDGAETTGSKSTSSSVAGAGVTGGLSDCSEVKE